ncbi:hypothetical protein [Streptomyces specialis]|uniref:hypothetical protein n=1 Tax=Streptomyces specialis TaxID=498367 RepID=UPI00099E5262|nr:hypothetical protein [Streptomyces specialis]
MNATRTMPEPGTVADRAREILTIMHEWPGFERLERSTRAYRDCWGTYTGYTTISEFDLERDKDALLAEALRVLALKTAVWELSGRDEHAAELDVSAPVDEMVHAILARHTVVRDMERATGLELVHMTDRETFNWRRGDYTHRCYAAAWGEPPERHWIDAQETARRHAILDGKLASIGITSLGRRHNLTFAAPEETENGPVLVPA